MSPPPPQVFTLPSGRKADYLISGDPNGFPLVWIHGTPGAYPPVSSFVQACEKKGIKVITMTRAGYGGSSRNKGRNVVAAVEDIRALNEHLGVKECLVGGWSGGGPHALACAARLPGCLAVLSVAGVAPYEAEGLDFMAGQGQDNIDEFNAYINDGEAGLVKFCDAQRLDILQADAAGLIDALSTILPEADKEVLRNSDLGEHSVDMMHEALKHNTDGWVDDDIAAFTPWGFELSEIKVPIILYQGDKDLMVPFSHGQWLAKHLPQERLKVHLLPGEGHLSVFVGHVDNMVDELKKLGGVKSP